MLSITEQLEEADKALQPIREALAMLRIGGTTQINPITTQLQLAYANSRSLLAMAITGMSVTEVVQALGLTDFNPAAELEQLVADAEPLSPPTGADHAPPAVPPAPDTQIALPHQANGRRPD